MEILYKGFKVTAILTLAVLFVAVIVKGATDTVPVELAALAIGMSSVTLILGLVSAIWATWIDDGVEEYTFTLTWEEEEDRS